MKVQISQAYALHPELLTAAETLRDALDRAKRVTELVDQTAGTAARRHSELTALNEELASASTDEALEEDAATRKTLRKAVDLKRQSIAAKTADLELEQLRIAELEKRAPALDEAVQSAASALNGEYVIWLQTSRSTIAQEVDAALPALLAVIATAKAVSLRQLDDFLSSVMVPDVLTHISTDRLGLTSRITSNRLNVLQAAPEAQARADEIRAQILPIEQLLGRARFHTPYVPWAQRQPRPPYQVKGTGSAYRPRGQEPEPKQLAESGASSIRMPS